MASLTLGAPISEIFNVKYSKALQFRHGKGFVKECFPKKKAVMNVSIEDVGGGSQVSSIPAMKTEATKKLSAWQSVPKEHWTGELAVEGEIPTWLNGTYLRNGPGLFHIGKYTCQHLFDGYATVIRLHFDNGRLIASHRQVESNAYKAAKEKGRPYYREFSEVLSDSNFLSQIGELAGLLTGTSLTLTDNSNAGVFRLNDGRVLCITETVAGVVEIDPDTLETIGKFEFSDGLGGLVHAAHPIVTDNEMITLMPDLFKPGYRVLKMAPGSNKRDVIGRVDCKGGPAPGWVHSFPVTDNYVVVPEMPLRYCTSNLLKAEFTQHYKFEWLPESKGYMHIMCKRSGKVVASVEVPLYITFHYINAYEDRDEDGRLSVVVDCCEHNADTTILHILELQSLRKYIGQDVLPNARVGRFRVPLDGSPKGTLESAVDPDEHGRGMDMCSINPAYRGKKYRYLYSCGAQRPCNFPNTLTKIDLEKKTATNWHDDGAVPSEPFFVQRPGAIAEDDGVLISLISEKDGGGYALVLDATTFSEVARTRLPYGLPYGLHGCWIPKK
ncbi:carotenoid cleavage dioxygenase 8 homolog B, chloroplastic [Amborella trichopoda]|uniref:Carotenoid cleavage dioxygenase 8 n=1 Tax=Amborella trichopoda TaxID=13333 RepID=W1PZE4_AMBTC|nr:carotenoid cleavage dioxygenase 8 homolog B, chloroplastic [Amborella trichopoda]ERN12955.1 hypothetical protein AMTR_s00050p00227710 [Amborella trichopoda]|eukprot:XP_006851374.1 carotenoid cleavage dioxygenase 8 homolog B, chloroplastic [Amborella trichopoda]